ncbi:MAG: substrate-binding domain-containing protein, partial [Rhizobium sp.]|nr:substrate-binding domain-containing protein [Rhizobium sp.]
MKKSLFAASLAALALGTVFAAPASAADVAACLITKTDTNPFFVKMKEGATAKAAELGVTLKAYAGKVDGDSESQVAAIETCIADGAKGILLTASDTKGIVPAVQKARDARLLVKALDTPHQPVAAAATTQTPDTTAILSCIDLKRIRFSPCRVRGARGLRSTLLPLWTDTSLRSQVV